MWLCNTTANRSYILTVIRSATLTQVILIVKVAFYHRNAHSWWNFPEDICVSQKEYFNHRMATYRTLENPEPFRWDVGLTSWFGKNDWLTYLHRRLHSGHRLQTSNHNNRCFEAKQKLHFILELTNKWFTDQKKSYK